MSAVTRALVLAALAATSCGPSPTPATPPVEPRGHGPAAARKEPRLLSLDNAAILLDDSKVMAAPRIKPGLGTQCELDLGPLTRALRGRTSPRPLRINVAADASFELLCSALRAVWTAGIVRVRLVVPGERPQEVGPPPLPPPAPAQLKGSLQLTVVMADTGFFVGGAGGVMRAMDGTDPTVRCRPPHVGGRCHAVPGLDPYDQKALKGLILRIKPAYPKERVAVITADPMVQARSVIRTLDTVRGKPDRPDRCRFSRGCLFDRVALDAFSSANVRLSGGIFLRQTRGSTRVDPRPVKKQTPPPVTPRPGGPVPPALQPTGLNPMSAQATLKTAAPAARACYEKSLAINPKYKGTVELGLVVGAKGRVSSVHVQRDDIGWPQLITCLRGVLSALRFPAPADGKPVGLVVPYVFAPVP